MRLAYVRMVLRSIPVTRSICRWLVLVASSVAIVVCRCGFKTFNPVSLKSEGVKVTSCLVLTEVVKQPGLTSRHASLRMGEFEVAISGGIWMAIRGCFRTHKGAQTYCVIRSYCATMHKQGVNIFEALVASFKGAPLQPSFY